MCEFLNCYGIFSMDSGCDTISLGYGEPIAQWQSIMTHITWNLSVSLLLIIEQCCL